MIDKDSPIQFILVWFSGLYRAFFVTNLFVLQGLHNSTSSRDQDFQRQVSGGIIETFIDTLAIVNWYVI